MFSIKGIVDFSASTQAPVLMKPKLKDIGMQKARNLACRS